MDLISLMEIIHLCNETAAVTVIPMYVAEQCSGYYQYTIDTYFAGDWEEFQKSYKAFEEMFSSKE